MQRTCDICGGEATRAERIVENGISREYAYCEACYNRAIKCGKHPHEEAKKRLARIGRECPVCGCTAESFEKTFLFGCPECYRYMKDIAADAVVSVQGGGVKSSTVPIAQLEQNKHTDKRFKSADECGVDDLVRDNVVSSRIRLARNVRGLEFPGYSRGADMRTVALINAAERAARGVFDASMHTMSKLTDSQKKMLLEYHFISLPLANNKVSGAVIVERGEHPEMSIMLNEEDHVREQCVVSGHALRRAYSRIKGYDENLAKEIELACDDTFGFLTACPTNVGTGMRASEMLFLPALRRTGAIDDALKVFKENYGLTVRGYFGEGSESAYDMYQISNTRTFGVSEEETLRQVEQAVIRMCYCERVALERRVSENDTKFFDGIWRSYGLLTSAYSMTAQELMKLLVDVKIGVILGILPIKSTEVLNKIIERCSFSHEIQTGGLTADERNKTRASIVRRTLAEGK